jgi:O-antigen/teichoic acid export membrane protein
MRGLLTHLLLCSRSLSGPSHQKCQAIANDTGHELIPGLRQTSWNVLVLWGHKLVSVAASFFVMGAATRLYGLEQIGVWIFATALASYLSMLDFGTSSALPRIVPKLRQRGNVDAIRQIVSTAFSLAVAVAIVGLVVLLAFGNYLVEALTGDTSGDRSQYAILVMTLLAGLVALPLRVGYGLLASVNRFDIYFGVDLAGIILRVILVFFVVVTWQCGIVMFATVALISPLMANIVQYLLGLRFNDLRIGWGDISMAAVKELLSHTGASLLLTFSVMLLIQGSTLAAAKLGTSAVAILAFPLLLITQGMSFGASAGALVSPVASALSVAGSGRLREMALGTISASSTVSVAIFLLLYFLGPVLLDYWLVGGKVDRTALEEIVGVLDILLWGGVFIGPAAAARGILMGIGKHWVGASVEFGSSIFGLLAGISMMASGQGTAGLAWGLALGFVARYIGLLAPLVGGVGTTLGAVVFVTGKPVIVGLVSIALSGYFFGIPSYDSGMTSAVGGASAAMSVWAIGTWWVVLNGIQREYVASRLKRVISN